MSKTKSNQIQHGTEHCQIN